MQTVHHDWFLKTAAPDVTSPTLGQKSANLPAAIAAIPEPMPLAKSAPKRFGRRDMIPVSSQQIWRIDQGWVRTTSCNEEGEIVTLGFWRSGEFIGQPWFNISPYQVECLTVVKASLLMAGSADYQQALTAHVQQTQAQQAQDLLIIMYSRQMESRLLNLLKWFARQFGQKVSQGWLIDLNLTHQDIADVLGTTRVTVTRLLKKLAQRGTIGWLQQRQIMLFSSSML
jgi:CRP-like cAMP-binding protein